MSFGLRDALDLVTEYYTGEGDLPPEQKEYNAMMGHSQNYQDARFWDRYMGTFESPEDFAREYTQMTCSGLLLQLPDIIADSIDYSRVVRWLSSSGDFIFRHTKYGVMVFSGS